MKIEYFIFDLVVGVLPIIGLKYFRHGIWPKWPTALKAIFAISIPYLIWDQLVTNLWWNFNPLYILGIRFLNLPLEEILFFLVVPLSCLVIWENLKKRIMGNWKLPIEPILYLIILVVTIFSLLNQKWYLTADTLLTLAVVFLSQKSGNWLRKKVVTLFLGIVLILILVFNGYLTSRPVVRYNPQIITNWKIGTVPIEDVIYGLDLIAAIAMLYEAQIARKKS